MHKTRSGFTIVELLIVIVVIAILATISIVAYRGVQTRAQAASIVSGLKAIEKALNAYKITSGNTGWWFDNSSSLTGTGNPTIASIIAAQPGFQNFLQSAPTTDGLGGAGSWAYDNDGDLYDGCSASTAGVNIYVSGPTNTSLMQAVDTLMDDGNLGCGVIHTGGGNLLYTISDNQ